MCKKLLCLVCLIVMLSGCSNLPLTSSEQYEVVKVKRNTFDWGSECWVEYNDNKQVSVTLEFPCVNIIKSTRDLVSISHGENNENVWVELTTNGQRNIVDSDRRSMTADEIDELMKEIEKDGRDCRIVKVETTDEKGVFVVHYKNGVNVDASTVVMEFSSWAVGSKNTVKISNKDESLKLVVLNRETSQNLWNSTQ